MNRTILAIRGRANQGKSKTICKVIEKLVKPPEAAKITNETTGESGDDKWLLADYHSGDRIVRIGITSEGDPGRTLKELLERFVDEPCDIILCASRTRGETLKWVRQARDKGSYDLIWLSNMRLEPEDPSDIDQIERQQDRCNEASANYVFGVMMELID